MNFRLMYWFVFALLMTFFTYSCQSIPSQIKTIQAVDGILDLSNWDFEKNGPVHLDGEWEFYWNELYTPESFTKKAVSQPLMVNVPSHWTHYQINGKNVPGTGYATFRLKIKMNKSQRFMALKLNTLGTVYRLWLNNEIILSDGTVGTNVRSEGFSQVPRKYIFRADSEDLVITIQISNFHFNKGGLWNSILFGEGYQILKLEDNQKFYNFFVVGAIFIMGLYHLLLFLLRKNDLSLVAFSIFCLTVSIRWFFTEGYFYSVIPESFTPLLKAKIEYLLIFLPAFSFCLYLYTLFQKEISVYFISIVGIVSLIFTFLSILLPVQVFDQFYNIYYLLIFAGSIYLIYRIIVAAVRKKNDALLVLLGFILLCLANINDILNTVFGFSHLYLLGTGLFVFIIIQSFILSIRFSNAFKRVEYLSNELQEYSKGLEQKVDERTIELKQANQNLASINKELESLDELKNDFIANITHDFRSPLMIIQNTTDLAIKYNKKLDDENAASFKIIYESSIRLKTTIDRLLDLAKMDATGIKLNISNIDLSSFISGITDFYKSALMTSEIEISDIVPVKKVELYSDKEKLEEIINNIISNAVKFVDMKRGRITIELAEFDDRVEISIEDNGIGIPQDKLGLIFDRFTQIDPDKNIKYRGTGIGLAFSKQLVEYLHGSLEARSEGPGKGSKFIITLKKGIEQFSHENFQEAKEKSKDDIYLLLKSNIEEKSDTSIVVDITEPNLDNEFDLKKALILIVDDNKSIREIEKKYFMNNGFKNFILASNGQDGLEACFNYKPDTIICDVNMPGMKGDQLQNELAGNPELQLIPFIFLTAISDRSVSIQRKRKGAVAFLSKPIDEDDLILTVELHLRKYFDYKKTFMNATIDGLTGLNNKSHSYNLLKKHTLIRSFQELSIIFIDIDNFKLINDSHGHKTGDLVLTAIGDTIKKSLRNYDIAGRYGGEEFIIALPDTGMANAKWVAEKLAAAIKKIEVNHENTPIHVSASFGIASLMANEEYICQKLGINNLADIYSIKDNTAVDWVKIEGIKHEILDLLISMADQALYEAKKTYCNACRFNSAKQELFVNHTCPECLSSNIVKGRDKIVLFNRQEMS